jgi:uncharacterized NAD(P)/FAD-binding protein YdhS
MLLARDPAARITLFDPCPMPATGPNFLPDDPQECLLNLPLRAIDLPADAAGGAFSDFLQKADPDYYAPRAVFGAYLVERYQALKAAYPAALTHHRGLVTDGWRDGDGWHVTLADAGYGPFDALILSPGQPATKDDDQIASWQEFAAKNDHVIMPAYPAQALIQAANEWTGKVVAIRGLALSAFDVVAMLTLGQGGRMMDGRYHASGREPALILPFSRDGLPPMPKPVAAEEDRYQLQRSETDALLDAIAKGLQADADHALRPILTALAKAVARITGQDPAAWLQIEADPDSDHPDTDPVACLQSGIAMAQGETAPSIAYATGQVWRKLQPDLRRLFHDLPPNDAARAEILRFDRGLKRVTYGPPVRSARLMLALVDAGLVQLSLADDPAIKLDKAGWVLDGRKAAGVMIDAVLPPPELDKLSDPLLRQLARKGYLQANPATGGIAVGKGGALGQDLYLLGRMGEGISIATDSIHDCFGIFTRHCADQIRQAQDA